MIDIADLAPVEPFHYYEQVPSAFDDDEMILKRMESRTACLSVTWTDGSVQALELPIVLTYPYFGGIRQWFQCPKCQRRVGKLYCASGPKEFMCRHCHRLVYLSQYWGRRPTFKVLRQIGLL